MAAEDRFGPNTNPKQYLVLFSGTFGRCSARILAFDMLKLMETIVNAMFGGFGVAKPVFPAVFEDAILCEKTRSAKCVFLEHDCYFRLA